MQVTLLEFALGRLHREPEGDADEVLREESWTQAKENVCAEFDVHKGPSRGSIGDPRRVSN